MAAADVAHLPKMSWLTVPPQPLSFNPESNPGLAASTSRLFVSNFMKSRNCYEESRDVRTMIRNDPLEVWAKLNAPAKSVDVNTGLNTSMKPLRPRSAQMTSLTRARSAGALPGLKAETWPVPVNPETGRPVRHDPRQRQFYPTGSPLTMGYTEGIFANPSRKVGPEVYMSQRYGTRSAQAVSFADRRSPLAVLVDSTGDLSVAKSGASGARGRARPQSAPVLRSKSGGA